jgi:hypothetical protein
MGMGNTNNDNLSYGTVYFPDRTPVPELLTESEAILFLRLDTDKTNDHARTMKHYRDKELLHPTLIGKNNKYSKKELLRFIDLMTEKTKKRNK